jgi:hypothetical protein
VLKMLDDQQLLDPNQLQALVRSRGKDAQVTVTLVRKGVEQKLQVQLTERMLPERRSLILGSADVIQNVPSLQQLFEVSPDEVRRASAETRRKAAEVARKLHEGHRNFQQRLQETQQRLRDWQQRVREWQKNPGAGPAPEPPQIEPPSAELNSSLNEGLNADLNLELNTDLNAHGGTDRAITLWNTGQAKVVLRDHAGVLEITTDNGKRTLTVKDAAGKALETKTINTPEDLANLPEAVRTRLKGVILQTTSDEGYPGLGLSLGQHPDGLAELAEAQAEAETEKARFEVEKAQLEVEKAHLEVEKARETALREVEEAQQQVPTIDTQEQVEPAGGVQ